MTDVIQLLQEWTQITTLGGALIVGYILKHYLPMDNKHIPLLMAVLGVLIAVLLNGYVSVEATIFGGALSGLASTGFHQVFKQYIENKDGDNQ